LLQQFTAISHIQTQESRIAQPTVAPKRGKRDFRTKAYRRATSGRASIKKVEDRSAPLRNAFYIP
jgi:hypothetical protein